VVIFSFSGSAAAPAIFIFHSMHGNEFRPDKPPLAKLVNAPGEGKAPRVFKLISIRKSCQISNKAYNIKT